MNLPIHQFQPRISSYQVSVPVFEGPLDLLLYLIEKQELDITVLSLAQVTDEYIRYINQLPEKDPENISGFLVVASKLIQIKSNVLLPRKTEIDPSDEESGEDLARQLIEYRKFKQLAKNLETRTHLGLRTYVRLFAPAKGESRPDFTGFNVYSLYDLAQKVFNPPIAEPLGQVVSTPKVTIREKISQIVTDIQHSGRASFYQVLNRARGKEYSRLHVVVAFLALLELVKRRRIFVEQDHIFSDIQMQPAEAWNENIETMELEFGE